MLTEERLAQVHEHRLLVCIFNDSNSRMHHKSLPLKSIEAQRHIEANICNEVPAMQYGIRTLVS